MRFLTTNPPQFRLPVFEGPLDLLLHLIRENRIDIYDIPIADITQQYLDYVALLESLDLAVAGEYIVMAATLVEIKARMLLPQAPPAEGEEEEMDPRAELVQKLLEYQSFQGSVDTLRGWEEYRRRIFFRGALENPDDYLLPLPAGGIDPRELMAALAKVLSSVSDDDTAVTAVVPRRRVSLRMKMVEVLRKVRAKPEGLAFSGLFSDPPYYTYDIVLTFLALLELIRQHQIDATQKQPGDDILLRPKEAEAA